MKEREYHPRDKGTERKAKLERYTERESNVDQQRETEIQIDTDKEVQAKEDKRGRQMERTDGETQRDKWTERKRDGRETE